LPEGVSALGVVERTSYVGSVGELHPVIKLADSEAKKHTAAATSKGLPSRCMGTLARGRAALLPREANARIFEEDRAVLEA